MCVLRVHARGFESPTHSYNYNCMMLIFSLLACSLLLPACSAGPETPRNPYIPAWADQFTSKFVVRVKEYGPDWSSNGVIYYDWTKKVGVVMSLFVFFHALCFVHIQTFRADYIKWCLPLFDSGPTDRNNYTCTFLATGGSMYFVNHTASRWQDNQCCTFEKVMNQEEISI